MTKPPAPYGMIEVKEGLDKNKEIRNVTVQYKVSQGYNPGAGTGSGPSLRRRAKWTLRAR